MSDGTWEVPTRCGRVAGAVRNGVGAFPGVPHAASATGPRRFGSPVAATPWTGVRRADEFGPTPPRAAGGLFDQPAGEHPLRRRGLRPRRRGADRFQLLEVAVRRQAAESIRTVS
ncbi:carboxylesterase family protein [Nocardia abscessus]|uniref:carboxylesterase family protein n=1 Tax=Nocardia abscessus TaxID=120957 RepID=UPI003CC7D95F